MQGDYQKKDQKSAAPRCQICNGPSVSITQRCRDPQDPSLFICTRCGRVLKPDGSAKNKQYF